MEERDEEREEEGKKKETLQDRYQLQEDFFSLHNDRFLRLTKCPTLQPGHDKLLMMPQNSVSLRCEEAKQHLSLQT